MEVVEIPIDKIIIPKRRARATFTPEQEAELRASIEKHGFYIPILVSDNGDGTYTLIDGEHRIKIVKEMGWEKIPAVIVEKDEKKIRMLNILANTARGEQNPMDVAEVLRDAYEAGCSIEELAAAMGHTTSWVKLYLTLTELPDVYKEALRTGKLKVGHIKEAMRLPDPIEIDAALSTALKLQWKVSELRYYVNNRLETLRLAQAQGDMSIAGPPPTPEEAQQIIQYGDCMFCHRKVRREDLMMPVICPDCRALLEWILDNLKDPREAMQTIYNALNLYFDYMKRQRQQSTAVVPMPASTNVEAQPAPQQSEDHKEQEIELSAEDLKLIKAILKLKKEGLL